MAPDALRGSVRGLLQPVAQRPPHPGPGGRPRRTPCPRIALQVPAPRSSSPRQRSTASYAEDMPYLDLTTYVLGIGEAGGSMEYFTREACVLCGTEEAARVAARLGCTVAWSRPSGTALAPGEAFMGLEGSAEQLPRGLEGLPQPVRSPERRGHQDPCHGRRRPRGQPRLRGTDYPQIHARRQEPAHQGGSDGRSLPPPAGPLRDRARSSSSIASSWAGSRGSWPPCLSFETGWPRRSSWWRRWPTRPACWRAPALTECSSTRCPSRIWPLLVAELKAVDPHLTVDRGGRRQPGQRGGLCGHGRRRPGDHGALYCQARRHERAHEGPVAGRPTTSARTSRGCAPWSRATRWAVPSLPWVAPIL